MVNRNATKGFKGYKYQYLLFITLMIEDHNLIDYIKFEGHEDIDIMYKKNDSKYDCIQTKYHTSESVKESFGKKDGFSKVINAYMLLDDEGKKKINKIIYLICNENKLHSSKIFLTLFENNLSKKCALLEQKYPTYNKTDIKEFVNKLQMESHDRFNINDFFTRMENAINSDEFFNFGQSHDYKKQIVLFRIIKETIRNIFKKNKKFNPTKMFSVIGNKLKKEYTADELFGEFMDAIKKQGDIGKYYLQQITTNDFLSSFKLEQLYAMHIKIEDDTTDKKIKLSIFKNMLKSIQNITNVNTTNEVDTMYEKCQRIVSHFNRLFNGSTNPNDSFSSKTCKGKNLFKILKDIDNPDVKCKKRKKGKKKNTKT